MLRVALLTTHCALAMLVSMETVLSVILAKSAVRFRMYRMLASLAAEQIQSCANAIQVFLGMVSVVTFASLVPSRQQLLRLALARRCLILLCVAVTLGILEMD